MAPQIIIASQIQCGMKYEYVGAPNFTDTPEHLWSAEEAARFLGIHVETVRLWARQRKISSVRLGKCDVRFRKSDLDEYVESRLNRRRSAFR
jgi:excisionase family DNA binding protein